MESPNPYHFEDDEYRPPNWPLVISLAIIVAIAFIIKYSEQIEKFLSQF